MIFSYCNMFLEKSQRKPLDISGEMAYNKREEGIPVDGLLPLAIKEITAQLGTWGGYFRLLLSCMMRMIWQMRLSKVSTSMSVIAITPFPGAWIRPPTVFRYALRALVYHICRGLSNLRNAKKALDISVQMAYNKREEGIPVDGLLP